MSASTAWYISWLPVRKWTHHFHIRVGFCPITLNSPNEGHSPWRFLMFAIPLTSFGVDGAVRFLVVGTIGKEERPQRGQLWMEQYLISLKYWPIWCTIWADPNYIWGLVILADSLLFSVNNILTGLWLRCISSAEITLFCLADILLQHRALFQCYGLIKWLQIHHVNWSRVFLFNDLST